MMLPNRNPQTKGMISRSSGPLFSCSYCARNFHSAGGRTQHIRAKHGSDGPEPQKSLSPSPSRTPLNASPSPSRTPSNASPSLPRTPSNASPSPSRTPSNVSLSHDSRLEQPPSSQGGFGANVDADVEETNLDRVEDRVPSSPGGFDADVDLDIENPNLDRDETPPNSVTRIHHPLLNGKSSPFLALYIHQTFIVGRICDKNGNDIPPDTPPPPRDSNGGPNDWTPYNNRIGFELADFLYRVNQMSAGAINFILAILAACLAPHGAEPPFLSTNHMYKTIDSTPLGDVAWETFSFQYTGARPPGGNIPSWMNTTHDIWFRDPRALVHNMISNPDFDSGFHYAPFQEYDVHGAHRFSDLMSGNWAWKQAVSPRYRPFLFYLCCCSLV
jgi:Plavaka transposase